MPSSLDPTPPTARRPILYGRALVEQQRLQQQAEQEAVKQEQFQQRERRLTAAREKFLENQALAADISAQRLQLEQETFRAKAIAAKADMAKEQIMLRQFTSAMTALGRLDPKRDTYDGDVARIKAANPLIFSSTGNQFNAALADVVDQQYKERNEFLQSRTKAEEFSGKVKLAAELGLTSPESMTADGLKLQKPEPGFETFSSFDEAKKKYQGAAIHGSAAPDGTFTVKGISTPSMNSTTSEVMSYLGSIPNKGSETAPAVPPAATSETPKVRLVFKDGKLVPAE